MMISKNHIKYIRSLGQQKFRKEHKTYVVEGIKNAAEWLRSGTPVEYLVALEGWLKEHHQLYRHLDTRQILIATEEDFEKISGFKTPNQILLTVPMPPSPVHTDFRDQWVLMLDRVQDPGNMGTIIRTADWFGIRHIICSPDCVELYNPKVIQATMGSLLRIQIHTAVLTDFLQLHPELATYAAVLGGQSLSQLQNPAPGIIIMGNESKGISPEVQALAGTGVTIPRIGAAESLNVSVATGIICHALIR